MARTTSPSKLVNRCPPECSYHRDKIGEDAAAALLLLRERGTGAVLYAREAAVILGHPVPTSNASRHLKHYRLEEIEEAPALAADPSKRYTDLEILDGIISSGFRNSKNWRPTIKDTLDAMKLKAQFTGSSAFEDMLAAMDAALDLEPEEFEVPESSNALGLPDEQGEPEPELAEPLVG